MALRLRTFSIEDDNPDRENSDLSAFLDAVEVERVDTAYDRGSWRVLVLYKDKRRQEEVAQIETMVQGELKKWRREVARNLGVSAEAVLSDQVMAEVAKFCPTTPMELRMVVSGSRDIEADHEHEIVSVVREILDSLA